MVHPATMLAFHRSGKPRGWVRWLLFDRERTPRWIFRRIIFKKNGDIRTKFKGYVRAVGHRVYDANGLRETDRYETWLHFNQISLDVADSLRESITVRGAHLPRISLVMPTYNTTPVLLNRAIGSVIAQIYENWELCIADDASSNPGTLETLACWAARDKRIKVTYCNQNGNISKATNIAAAMTSAEFVAFLDHDDALTPDALAELAIAASENPEADYLYSDDDKIDQNNNLFGAQFKPDWSPTLLLSYMYMGHIKMVRRSLFDLLGGFRLGYEGAQDYDFALRMSERARKVVHVPKVLYHWGVVPGSLAASGSAKPSSFEAGRRAVAETFMRRGIACEVVRPKWAEERGVGVFVPRFPDSGPSVAILIPTKNKVEMLKGCVESLGRTTYRNYKIVIIDNESDEDETLAYLAQLPYTVLRIASPPGISFNFAHINNEAVKQVDAEYVLLLNNDTVVRSPEWLSQMMGYAQMHKVGAVGARLLFGDGTVQHAGIVHGLYGGMAGPAFRGAASHEHGYLSYGMVAREYSAVTAACMLTPRSLYLELGGLDEETFPVAYNDVDYCYRLIDAGWRCIYCPTAELYHYEGKTRGHIDSPHEVASFRQRYARRVDRWYNPNLSLDDEHFRVRPYHAPSKAKLPVRAVMVTHNLNHEGAPNSQFEMATGLARMGVLDPIVLSPVDGPLRMQYEKEGIPVHIVQSPLTEIHTLDAFDKRQVEFAILLRKLRAEVVYGNTLQTFWAIDAGERARLPTLWNIRESEPWATYFDYLAPELRIAALACFDLPYRVIFVSHATRQGWSPLETRHNFAVIHNGIDLSRLQGRLDTGSRQQARNLLGIAPHEVAIVLVGTVCERKGQIDLVRTLPHLSPQVQQRVRIFVVGDRPSNYSDAMHHEIGQLPLKLRQRLVVEAETGSVNIYYKAADIAVCTSRVESYPRVILEAMAHGLPIVSTPVFGIREQIREGINGLFYEAGDTRQLAAALSRLVENGAERASLAENSHPVLNSLTDYSEMIDGYGRLFQEARLSRGLSSDLLTNRFANQTW